MTEAMLSVTLLGVGAVVMGSLITSAITANRVAKEYLLAHNLATEAIEGIKNLRNSNWLKSPAEPDCWLRIDPTEPCGTAPKMREDDILIPVEYDLSITEENGEAWSLIPPEGSVIYPLDLESQAAGQEEYRLFLEEINSGAGTFEKYVTEGVATADAESSPYHRAVEVLELGADTVLLKVRVQWETQSKIRTIDRYVRLYNYF